MRNSLIAVLLAIILTAGGTAWFLSSRKTSNGTTIDTSQTAVITQIRQLGRLETSSFTVEKVIEAKKDSGGTWSNILFGDKLLLIAHGDVVAGVDLSGVSAADVSTIDGRLHLTLPPAQIFSVTLDNKQTRVYDRSKGLLTQGDQNLESEARQSAEQSIREAACAGKILEQSSEGAVKQLKALLTALGFKEAVVEIPAGKC